MLLVLVLSALLLPQGSVAAPQNAGPPLREQELLMMVHSKTLFTEQQIVEMLQTRGIGFRLTDSTRKALKKEGASAAVLAAVEKAAERLKRTSSAEEAKAAAAAVPKPMPLPPPLDAAAQSRLLKRVGQHALEYTEKLPNFICLQVTRRFVDFSGRGNFQPEDVIQARLAYNEHRESYQVIAVNEHITDRSYDSLGGATSTGEFGTMLHDLFLPATQAQFDYVGPAALRDRQVQAFDFVVSSEFSHWHIIWQRRTPEERSIIAGYSGRIIVDAEKEQVLRLWMQAEHIPADFPVRAAATTLDYDYAAIAGQPFLLPARAVVEMKESRAATRNEISFRQYRRFTAEAKVTFDENPEPAKPPEKPAAKPQPPKPKP